MVAKERIVDEGEEGERTGRTEKPFVESRKIRRVQAGIALMECVVLQFQAF
jgi:hypothetical protein